jgi:probable rRNA maturation factor
MARRVTVQYAAGGRPGRGGAAELAGVNALARRAVTATLADQEIFDAVMSVTLLADDDIARMNERHLAHAGPTDVLSFALFESGEAPLGDIYIGVGQARRQAVEHGVDVREEIARLAVHGTLHVLGHDHPKGERGRSPMWKVQERIVAEVMGS